MHQPLDEGAEGTKGGIGGCCDWWIPEVQGWTGRRHWVTVLQEGVACCRKEACPTYCQLVIKLKYHNMLKKFTHPRVFALFKWILLDEQKTFMIQEVNVQW